MRVAAERIARPAALAGQPHITRDRAMDRHAAILVALAAPDNEPALAGVDIAAAKIRQLTNPHAGVEQQPDRQAVAAPLKRRRRAEIVRHGRQRGQQLAHVQIKQGARQRFGRTRVAHPQGWVVAPQLSDDLPSHKRPRRCEAEPNRSRRAALGQAPPKRLDRAWRDIGGRRAGAEQVEQVMHVPDV